jgi:ABC-2 type transport system permease protein
VVDLLPFRNIVDVPFRLYTGNIAAEQIGSVLAHDVVWVAALVILGRAMLARASRRLVVQGG